MAVSLGYVYALRDLAKRKFINADFIYSKFKYGFFYLLEKIKGLKLIFKDHNDYRVR
jgi:hypothetical protein